MCSCEVLRAQARAFPGRASLFVCSEGRVEKRVIADHTGGAFICKGKCQEILLWCFLYHQIGIVFEAKAAEKSRFTKHHAALGTALPELEQSIPDKGTAHAFFLHPGRHYQQSKTEPSW